MKFTQLFKHLVAFIENKIPEVFQLEESFLDEVEDSPWCTDNNMGWLVLEDLLLIGDGFSSIEDLGLDLHEFAQSDKLLVDLVGEFSGVA